MNAPPNAAIQNHQAEATSTNGGTPNEGDKSMEDEVTSNNDGNAIQEPVAISTAPASGSSRIKARSSPSRFVSQRALLPKPSYYIDSYREHFFPHPEDGAVDGTLSSAVRKKLSVPQRYAMSMARRPWTHLCTAFTIAVVLSFVGLVFGDFKVVVDNAGWWSRGTLVADRASQEIMVITNREELFADTTGEFWEELMTVTQPNWQTGDSASEQQSAFEGASMSSEEEVCSGEWYGSNSMIDRGEKPLIALWKTEDAESKNPALSVLDANAMYDLCTAEETTLNALQAGDACHKCTADNTPSSGEGGKCIAPYSLILMARLHLAMTTTTALQEPFDRNDKSKWSGLSQSFPCDALRSMWTPRVQDQFTIALKTCVDWSVFLASGGRNRTITVQDTTITVTDPCAFPVPFLPTVVDELFAETNKIVRYSSSYYATKNNGSDIQTMFDASQDNEFDKSDDDPLSGVYDTSAESFYEIYQDGLIGRDMSLAVGSAGVTLIAMVMHTQSPFLTLMGFFQIILSFPLAYFVYHFIGQLVFFPFLNFIGIFVVFALGADDVFVAVDKWKSARSELPHGTTEQIAALALPDAACAMGLTSMTTAVAFFGSCICPVGPITCFAVFCGLLVSFNYLMNILLVFPALCLYDKWMLTGRTNCCVNFDWCCVRKGDAALDDDDNVQASSASKSTGKIGLAKSENGVTNDVEEQVASSNAKVNGDIIDPDTAELDHMIQDEHETLIHRVLDGYYNILHRFRWLVLAIVVAGFTVCAVIASRFSLPPSSEVALLPNNNEYQMHATWQLELLSTKMARAESSEALILWGVTPADTGDHLNPDTWTALVLDDTFNPRAQESQSFLIKFCDRLFAYHGKVEEDYKCPMNLFDEWLQEQSTLETPTGAYTQHCNGASAVPVPSNVFDPCIIAWSKLVGNDSVLQTGGSVKIMTLRTKSDVQFFSPFNELADEYDSYEKWVENERNSAPIGVNHMFHSALSFWWSDTNQQMLKAAYGAAGIALVCASVIIFISSRSFTLTLFALFSIVYVLLATTACLVGLGWNLGFLESVLFAILIGISCDFVIHFGHAYTMYSGNVNMHHRSHFALTHMGPSILAAAFTTFAAAVVMLFTEITFFQKFATMLFMTIVHSTLGCFIVFLVLCDCFGPSEPTKGFDTIKEKLCGKKE